jgi:inner membrane transporter RhtA
VQQLTRRTTTLFPVCLLLLAIVCVQAGASLAKTLFPLIGPLGTVAARTGFGTVVLALVLRPWRARITAQSRLPLLIYGISLALMNTLFYKALSVIPQGVCVALEFVGPLGVAIWSSRRVVDLCWITLAVGGLLMLLPIANPVTSISMPGALYALAAGVCWGLYIIFGQKAGADHGARTAALGSVISAVLVVPIGVADAGSTLLSRSVLLSGVAVGILSTAIPYALEMIALTRLPAQTFGVLASLDPAIGALCGLWYLGEQLTVLQWLALVMIMVASAGTTFTSTAETVIAPLD